MELKLSITFLRFSSCPLNFLAISPLRGRRCLISVGEKLLIMNSPTVFKRGSGVILNGFLIVITSGDAGHYTRHVLFEWDNPWLPGLDCFLTDSGYSKELLNGCDRSPFDDGVCGLCAAAWELHQVSLTESVDVDRTIIER